MKTGVAVCVSVMLVLIAIQPSFQFPKDDVKKDDSTKIDVQRLENPVLESENISAEERDIQKRSPEESGDLDGDSNSSRGRSKAKKSKKSPVIYKTKLFDREIGQMNVEVARDKESGNYLVNLLFESKLSKPTQWANLLHELTSRSHD